MASKGPLALRTRLRICQKKLRFPTEADAAIAAEQSGLPLRFYRCDRCQHFHLTSRTKGKRVPRAQITVQLEIGCPAQALEHKRLAALERVKGIEPSS